MDCRSGVMLEEIAVGNKNGQGEQTTEGGLFRVCWDNVLPLSGPVYN